MSFLVRNKQFRDLGPDSGIGYNSVNPEELNRADLLFHFNRKHKVNDSLV